jgi:hypothetical protein
LRDVSAAAASKPRMASIIGTSKWHRHRPSQCSNGRRVRSRSFGVLRQPRLAHLALVRRRRSLDHHIGPVDLENASAGNELAPPAPRCLCSFPAGFTSFGKTVGDMATGLSCGCISVSTARLTKSEISWLYRASSVPTCERRSSGIRATKRAAQPCRGYAPASCSQTPGCPCHRARGRSPSA